VAYEGYEAIRVVSAAGIATVTIDNPPINLFDLRLYAEMGRVAAELEADDDVQVVVLRSAVDGFFIAHFDVSVLAAFPKGLPEPTELNDFLVMCERFRTMPKATIAVIEGRAGGGGSELVLSCDLRYAALGRAVLNQPEVALGIVPGAGGMQRLARLMGRSRTLEVVLGCDDVDAETADRWGWVNRALPPDELWPFVDRLAARIASWPRQAVVAAKAATLRAEKEVVTDLLGDAAAFLRTLDDDGTRGVMARFLATGGQTVEGELRLGELAGELGSVRSAG
jgi:enoyl-CoA hydratase/carnithine racemase